MLALLGSCAALEPKREVVDNILSSNSPKMRVKVDPAFKYLGDVRYGIGIYDTYKNRWLLQQGKCHAFVFVTAEETMIKKVLVIDIRKRKGTWTWLSDQTSDVENILDQGKLRLAGKRFQYYSKVVRTTMRDRVVEYVYHKGYTTPTYGLKTRIVRVLHAGKTLISFDYLEKIPFSRFGYSTWSNKDDLYDEQLNWLEVSKKHAMASFEILK